MVKYYIVYQGQLIEKQSEQMYLFELSSEKFVGIIYNKELKKADKKSDLENTLKQSFLF